MTSTRAPAGACLALFMAMTLGGAVRAAAAVAGPPPAFAEQTSAPPAKSATRFVVETVGRGLVHPWSVDFLPDGRFLVTERAGRLRIIGRDGSVSAPLRGLPAMRNQRLLDVRLDPRFAENRLLYFNFSEARPDGNGLSVARARLSPDGTRLERVKIILRAQRALRTKLASGRLAPTPDGYLYVTVVTGVGERGLPKGLMDSQQLDVDPGKVLRIRTDGAIPADNPFVGKAEARPEIFDLGHRDMQGAAINPTTGELWVVEHGAKGGDEVNIVRPGRNYGWPLVSYGVEYDETPVGTGLGSAPGFEEPIYFWRPDIGPSGMMFYTGSLFPEWKGDLFVGALTGKRLVRLMLRGERVVGEEPLLRELDSRIRDVRQGPDGAIYLLTDEDAGRLLRLVPQIASGGNTPR